MSTFKCRKSNQGDLQEKRSTNEKMSRVLKTSMRKIDRVKKRFVHQSMEAG
jgi:hypothetical protein